MRCLGVPGGGIARREQAKSVRDRLRDRVEREFERVWAAYSDGLEAVDSDGSRDFRARSLTASQLLAEAYGKPVQPTENHSGPPIVIVRPPRDVSPEDLGEQHPRWCRSAVSRAASWPDGLAASVRRWPRPRAAEWSER